MPMPSRREATFVITSDAMPTVSEVMSLSPRSRSGSSGKKRMADRGSTAVAVRGNALVPACVGPQHSVMGFEHRFGVRDVEVRDLVFCQPEREQRDDPCREPRQPRLAQCLENKAPTAAPALDQTRCGPQLIRRSNVRAQRHRGSGVQCSRRHRWMFARERSRRESSTGSIGQCAIELRELLPGSLPREQPDPLRAQSDQLSPGRRVLRHGQ